MTQFPSESAGIPLATDDPQRGAAEALQMDEQFAQDLQAQTRAAEERLAALFERLRREAADHELPASSLGEFRNALEELKTPTEQLAIAADAVAALRREAAQDADRYRDLFQHLAVPCIVTSEDGRIADANRLGSKLLNVGSPYFKGKPLFLYLPQRETFFDLMQQVAARGLARARMTVRPRDRKPLPVDVTVTAWRGEWCWVMTELPPQSAETGSSKHKPLHGRTNEQMATE